jgi:hypothetical protein
LTSLSLQARLGEQIGNPIHGPRYPRGRLGNRVWIGIFPGRVAGHTTRRRRAVTIVGILVVIILILLVIYLIRRV